MKKLNQILSFLALILLLLLVVVATKAQNKPTGTVSKQVGNSHTKLNVTIRNMPYTSLVLGAVYGDKFTPIDSLILSKGSVSYTFAADMSTGVYRLVMGRTTYAKVMNEAPQQLDFIFNKEDIEIETDFNAPADSIKVLKSEENKAWFAFLKEEKQYIKKLKEPKIHINYFQKHTSDYYTEEKKQKFITQYNNFQKERNTFITESAKLKPNLFASRLMQMYRKPFLDGKLLESQRKDVFRAEYLNLFDFNDESLLNSEVYTQTVFKHIMAYAQKGLTKQEQEVAFNRAIDCLLTKLRANEHIAVFVIDYLMRGFERLGFNELLTYIAEHYTPDTGCVDETATLQRRLAYQKMTKGTTMPNLTLPNNMGKSISLSDVHSHYKLIFFWESNCPACRHLLLQLKKWYNNNKTVDLEVLAISIDIDEAAWQASLRQNDYPWLNLIEAHQWDGDVASAYKLYATPTLFLLNAENKLIAKPLSLDELLNAL